MDDNSQLVQKVLKFTYGVVPVVAGLDKFTNLLSRWDQYVAPQLAEFLSIEASTLMPIVGIIEILAGVLVFLKPKLGGLVVMGWLAAIALSLLAGGSYIDVAVRDLVMAVGAFSLYKLSDSEPKRFA